jgi:hypothetical protein
MNTDHILPKNPLSIGAVASLLADSNLLARYEKGNLAPNSIYSTSHNRGLPTTATDLPDETHSLGILGRAKETMVAERSV